jgi:gamma-glutamyl hercynylcysteine S-oxide synthase
VFVEWYRRNRARSRALFDLLSDDAYFSRPISLRHPIVFYEGHLPAFTFNTLIKRALARPSIDAELEQLFARGVDPHEPTTEPGSDTSDGWPCRARVLAFSNEVDRQVEEALLHEELNRPGDPLLDGAEAVFSVLEHEAMHQETLLYMWHLRTCQTCGGTRCCDSSPNRHASKHARVSGHPVIASAEPGERWLYCYVDDDTVEY